MKYFTKRRLIQGFTFIVTLAAFLLMIVEAEKNEYSQERERVTYITMSHAGKLQYVMNTLLQKTRTLEMLVVKHDGKVEGFEEIAKKLTDDDSIRSLQLAPDGVVKYVYPLEGNEGAFKDLFEDPKRATEARYARDTGKLTMSGPFELAQGGLGVVGRLPIYLLDEQEKKRFWGFSIIVLDMPQALYPANLAQLEEEGFSYTLKRVNPDTKEDQIFDRSAAPLIENPVDISFELPNATWTFSITPKKSWISLKALIVEGSIALLISVLITLLTSVFLTLKKQQKELKHLSITDALTGLFNRRMLQKILEKMCKASGAPFILCYMDLNGFKSVNDTYGHVYGDLLLKECARRIQDCLKQTDVLFRIGGDEFVALVSDEASKEMWMERIKRISESVKKPFQIDDYIINISVSIGYAVYPQDSQDGEKLLNLADNAMYQAKIALKTHLQPDISANINKK